MVSAADLTLYHYDSCPFCRHVFFAARNLGLELADKDIFRDPAFMDELMEARGARTVPVLRIRQADGTDRWLPESADIIKYLSDEVS
ncbi:MAG: glutathione S-transferase N-terminal domain-containing protein [Nannocystaceae bacterium]|nr:glutathione S-transferase N-terminal domain-containing protein [Nannocystaceae bacterium]